MNKSLIKLALTAVLLASCSDTSNTQKPIEVQKLSDPHSMSVDADTSIEPYLFHDTNIYGMYKPLSQYDIEVLNYELAKDSNHELPSNIRFGEFIITKSAYDNWENENGLDYLTWLHVHADFFNTVLFNSEPKIDTELKIKRVIIVDDTFTQNPSGWLPDIDNSEFYNSAVTGSSYIFDYSIEGDLINLRPRNAGPSDLWNYSIKLDTSRKLIQQYKNSSVDLGRYHEWCHRFLGVQDEYIIDFDDTDGVRFRYIGGPNLEPYISHSLRYEIIGNIRSGVRHDRVTSFAQAYEYINNVPDRVSLNGNFSQIRISLPQYQRADYYNNNNKTTKPIAMDMNNGSGIDFTPYLEPTRVENDLMMPMSIRIDLISERSGNVHLFLPLTLFNMLKQLGIDDVKLNIELIGNNFTGNSVYGGIYNVNEIDKIINDRRKYGSILAEMEIANTDYVFIWFNGFIPE